MEACIQHLRNLGLLMHIKRIDQFSFERYFLSLSLSEASLTRFLVAYSILLRFVRLEQLSHNSRRLCVRELLIGRAHR